MSSTIWAPDYINVSFMGAIVPVYPFSVQGKLASSNNKHVLLMSN